MSLDYPKSLYYYNNLHLRFFNSSKGLISGFNLITLPTFDSIFILFPTRYLPRFCLVSRSILITVIHGGVLWDFQKPLLLKQGSPTFHYRSSTFCYQPFLLIRTLKILKNKSIFSPIGKRSQNTDLKSDLLSIRSAVHI